MDGDYTKKKKNPKTKPNKTNKKNPGKAAETETCVASFSISLMRVVLVQKTQTFKYLLDHIDCDLREN